MLLFVEILVFVHADPRPSAAQRGRDGRLVAEHPGRAADQLIHINQAAGGQIGAQGRTIAGQGPVIAPVTGAQGGYQPPAVTLGTGDVRGRLEPGGLVGHAETGGEAGLSRYSPSSLSASPWKVVTRTPGARP